MTSSRPAVLRLVRSAACTAATAPLLPEVAALDPVTLRDVPIVVLPRSPIHVEGVVGDELFRAVAFLGEALDLPNLVPAPILSDDVDVHDADTAEFGVVLPFARTSLVLP